MKEYAYLIDDGRLTKIGRSTNPEGRVKNLRTGNPFIELVGYGSHVDENVLHSLMHENRVKGEWFYLTDGQKRRLLSLMRGEIKIEESRWAKRRLKKYRTAVDNGHGILNRYANHVVEFGQFKGWKLTDVLNRDYVDWVIENVRNMSWVELFEFHREQVWGIIPDYMKD